MAARQTLQATVTINAAFLQEIKDVNQELWDLLAELQRVMTSPPGSPAECHCIEDQLERLRDDVALHFALEEAYGYFEDPVGAAPHLCDQALQLRSEHQSLYLRLTRFVERVQSLNHRGRLPRQWTAVCREFKAFHNDLSEHETREHELILRAYDEDIGVGD